MSKKTRSERRKAQLQRAVRQGTPAALSALAQRSADAGARAILQAIASSPETTSDPAVAELAANVCERLRADDDFDTALRLASAFHRHTPRLCLEEALAAFALGDDERALDAASAHREVQHALAPVLAVAREGRVPNTPAAASSLLRGLSALARSVTAARSGRGSHALAALRPIADDVSGRLLVSEMRLAVALVAGRVRGIEAAARALGSSSLVKKNDRVAGALAQSLATRAPQLFIDALAAQLPFPESVKTEALLQASMAAAGLDTGEARVSLLIAKIGHGAFPAAQQGAAALYEGFAFVLSDPPRAQKAFDRAVALGADMGEALRGRFLALRAQYQQANRDFDDVRAQGLGRAAASTAMRLHAALARVPGAAALAIVSAMAAAEILADNPERERILEPVRAARSCASSAGLLQPALEAQLLVYEADAVPENRPARALELVKQALALDPKQHQAWHLRIELAEVLEGADAVESLVLQAGELEVCGELREEARAIRLRRGLGVPLAPGKVDASELAAELRRRVEAGAWSGSPEPFDADLAACRAALDTAGRRALDAAAFVLLRQHEHAGGVSALLRFLAAQGDGLQDTLLALAVISALMQWEDAAIEVASTAGTPARVAVVAEVALQWLLRGGHGDAARKLVFGVASAASASGLKALRKQLDGASKIPAVAPAEELGLLREAARSLAPHFRFPSELEDATGPINGGDRAPAPHQPGPPAEMVRVLLKRMRVSSAVMNAMTPAELSALGVEIASLVMSEPTKATARRMSALLGKLGVSMNELFAAFGMDA